MLAVNGRRGGSFQFVVEPNAAFLSTGHCRTPAGDTVRRDVLRMHEGVMKFQAWVRQAGLPLAVLCLLGLVVLAASLSSPDITQIPLDVPSPKPPPTKPLPPMGTRTLPPPGEGTTIPAWVGIVALALAIAVVIGVLVVIARLILSRRTALPTRSRSERADDAVAPAPEEVREAVQAGIDELDDDSSDPRRAVIACWLRLESTAAMIGLERQPGDTPSDLVGRLLEVHQASSGVLDRLADVYRQARYAPHVVDESMRIEARTALEQLRTELTSEEVESR